MQPRTLAELLRHLTSGEPKPLPDASLVHQAVCLLEEGQTQEVDEDTFDYFLDVLPPRDMGGGWFAFAEGMEPLRFFWRRAGKFFCRQLSWPETHELMRLRRGGTDAPS
jgi:hypothetical protein